MHALGTLLLVFTLPAQAEPGLLHQWQFGKTQFADKLLKPTVGTLPATVHGPIAFSKDQPEVLILPGDTQAKHRLALLDDHKLAKLPAQNLSVEAWVWVDRVQEWGGILSALQDNGDYEKGWLLGFQKDTFCFGLASQAKKKLTYLRAKTTFQLGYWYHVVGTYDGAEMCLYVDGQLQGRSTEQKGAIDYPPKTFFTLAAYHDDNELYSLAGRLERVSVFERALTPAEVNKRFQERKKLFPDIDPVRPTVIDWPTALHDNLRTGVTDESLPPPLHLHWEYRTHRPPAPSWPEEAKHDYWHNKINLDERVIFDRAFHVVCVGDRVYFASSSEDKVCCLDANTGQLRWSFLTEGPVRLAPTLAADRVLFGCDDGYAYCLHAKDGALVWKQRLAPGERRLAGNQRVVSAWPIRTDLLVEGDKAYACVGVFPSQGVSQVTLDVATGKILESQPLSVTAQGYLERRGGKLHVATGRSPAGQFVTKLQRQGKDVGKELNALPKEYPHAFIAAGEYRFGGGAGEVACFRAEDGKKVWSAKVTGRAYSVAAVRGRLFVSTDQGHLYCFSGQAQPSPRLHTFTPSKQASPKEIVDRAADLWQHTRTKQGYALVLGVPDKRLLRELALQSEMQILCLSPEVDLVHATRRWCDEQGLSGRVSIQQGDFAKLPYADYLFNLVLADNLREVSADLRTEIERVLRPHGGVAVLGSSPGEVYRRPSLVGEGEWTHFYANGANTVCSNDARVKGALELLWFGQPGPRQMIDRHHRTAAPLYKQGRLFIPAEDKVLCVDAYNGTNLWAAEVKDSRRVVVFRDCSQLVLDEHALYLAGPDKCYALSPTTGKPEFTYPLPTTADEPRFEWGYVNCVGSTLVGSACKPGSTRRQQSSLIDRTETYYDFVPVVGSEKLFGLDRKTGATLWTYRPKQGLLLNPTLTSTESTLYFVESGNPDTLKQKLSRAKLADAFRLGAELVALEMHTGRELWRKKLDLGRLQHHVYLAYAQDKLVLVGTRNSGTDKKTSTVLYDLWVLEAKAGALAWQHTQDSKLAIGGDHGEQEQHPVLVGDKLYLEPFAYQLHTGKPLAWDWPWQGGKKRSGCGTLSAGAESFFFRDKTVGTFDLRTNKAKPVTTETRPGCWINLLPAGGLLLAPEASSGCSCDFAVQTSFALIPVKK